MESYDKKLEVKLRKMCSFIILRPGNENNYIKFSADCPCPCLVQKTYPLKDRTNYSEPKENTRKARSDRNKNILE